MCADCGGGVQHSHGKPLLGNIDTAGHNDLFNVRLEPKLKMVLDVVSQPFSAVFFFGKIKNKTTKKMTRGRVNFFFF